MLRARRLERSEEFLTHPGRAVVEAGALLALVILLALLIPAGPLALDSRWSELMQDIETARLTHLALIFNDLGRGVWRALTLAAIGLVLLVARRWAALIAFAFAEALAPLLGNVIKAIVDRTRPPAQMLTAHGSSFPSGHAAYASATVVALVLLFSTPGRRRLLWFSVAAAVTVAMAWSRTYLQVHWLSDVLAGATLGLAVTLVSFGVVQITFTRQPGDPDRPHPRRTSGVSNASKPQRGSARPLSRLLEKIRQPRGELLAGDCVQAVLANAIIWVTDVCRASTATRARGAGVHG